ncbi:hypothetical protein OG271_25045 [Micromonospora rifamycinica]|uniref:hypothetical protein n=1 Tax=Micromonospora rifamycinica TaxID=291594 RepID=UPI002E2B0750|nr:hypothetical protein [Micromonospora rifamycinica]
MNERPRPGDLLVVDRAASVQFAGERALRLRVVSVCDRPTYDGWLWLTGYVLDRRGEATAKREVFAQLAGLRHAPATMPPSRAGLRHAPATTRPSRAGRHTADPPETPPRGHRRTHTDDRGGRRAVASPAPLPHAGRRAPGPPAVDSRVNGQPARPDGAR